MTGAGVANPATPSAKVHWSVRPIAPPEAVYRLAKDLSVPPLLASVLWARGVREEALESLKPPLELTAISTLDEAAARLEQALRSKKRILIHGDYDADGISGAAVLTLGLRALGGNATPFIPNRLTDGYGISPQRVAEHADRAELLLTVDCGISNISEIQELQARGVEVIVSDHHHPGEALPDCLVVHPTLSEAQRGLPALTGAGVAYHLLWALHERLGLAAPLEYSDLATIGIVADVAPLLGENRALVQEGLARMADSRWPGLRAAVAQSHLRGAPTARDVAFVLAPRLNAAGRLGEADKGLELLLTQSERRARELAVFLDTCNGERRQLEQRMLTEALQIVEPDAPALVVTHPGWHPGVMGIVASRLLERFYKPVFIIAAGKGSVRSTPGISAVGALQCASTHLIRYGGHSQAAGFTLREEELEAFRRSIHRYVEDFPAPQPHLIADALIGSDDISADLYRATQQLEPYGEGHRAPLFALEGNLEHVRAVGQGGKHLQLRIGGVRGVSWNSGELAASLKCGNRVNAAVNLRENTWQGRTQLEFLAEEVCPAEPLAYEDTDDAPNICRGPPGSPTDFVTVDCWHPGQDVPEKLWLKVLPLGRETPLHLTCELSRIIAQAETLHLDLEEALETLEQSSLTYPTLSELRRAFVTLERGQKLPYDDVKNDLCMRALQELELLDAHGRARNRKCDPYQSETFLKGLLERYKLRGFANAYRHLDEPSFAKAVTILFSVAASSD